ncbi:MAG: transcription antitermination factor NusB [Cyclobacteriaceae bacterium]|nr:transcription antitermination factor NusB [Cyclobacteriaceae bacterium]
MLNRRTLRIKTMQAIFAFMQSKKSHYNIGKQNIEKSFSRDLNSMEVQDSALLVAQSDESKKLYEQYYNQKGIEVTTSKDEKVNQITTDTIANYYNCIEKDRLFFRSNMVIEAEKIIDRYILMLQLLVEFAQFAQTDKRIKGKNFVKNLLIDALKFNKSLENMILKHNLSWKSEVDDLKSWYKELLRKDETFIEYLNKDNPNFSDDSEIVQHLIKAIFKNDLVTSFMEERDINWAENRAIVRSMVLKTIKEIGEENSENFELMELSYNWEEDKDFFVKLYNETLSLGKEYKEMIAQRTKNWEVDRLAAVDRIALEMGVTEMLNFSSIPVKVTINEYIELVKNYSTPKSKQFINGILDTISKDLTVQGKIKKSGRGLIDNR